MHTPTIPRHRTATLAVLAAILLVLPSLPATGQPMAESADQIRQRLKTTPITGTWRVATLLDAVRGVCAQANVDLQLTPSMQDSLFDDIWIDTELHDVPAIDALNALVNEIGGLIVCRDGRVLLAAEHDLRMVPLEVHAYDLAGIGEPARHSQLARLGLTPEADSALMWLDEIETYSADDVQQIVEETLEMHRFTDRNGHWIRLAGNRMLVRGPVEAHELVESVLADLRAATAHVAVEVEQWQITADAWHQISNGSPVLDANAMQRLRGMGDDRVRLLSQQRALARNHQQVTVGDLDTHRWIHEAAENSRSIRRISRELTTGRAVSVRPGVSADSDVVIVQVVESGHRLLDIGRASSDPTMEQRIDLPRVFERERRSTLAIPPGATVVMGGQFVTDDTLPRESAGTPVVTLVRASRTQANQARQRMADPLRQRTREQLAASTVDVTYEDVPAGEVFHSLLTGSGVSWISTDQDGLDDIPITLSLRGVSIMEVMNTIAGLLDMYVNIGRGGIVRITYNDHLAGAREMVDGGDLALPLNDFNVPREGLMDPLHAGFAERSESDATAICVDDLHELLEELGADGPYGECLQQGFGRLMLAGPDRWIERSQVIINDLRAARHRMVSIEWQLVQPREAAMLARLAGTTVLDDATAQALLEAATVRRSGICSMLTDQQSAWVDALAQVVEDSMMEGAHEDTAMSHQARVTRQGLAIELRATAAPDDRVRLDFRMRADAGADAQINGVLTAPIGCWVIAGGAGSTNADAPRAFLLMRATVTTSR